jgi:HlyD family secretion protein
MQARARTFLTIAVAAAAVALVVFAFWPSPAPVDAARAVLGPLEVTVDEQGETRSHDRFVVAAPVSGRLLRIALHDGDAVTEGEVVAVLAPVPLSVREREEQEARVTAAAALSRDAEARARHAREDYEQAQRESTRVDELFKRGLVPRQQAEQARNATVTLGQELEAAQYRARSAAADLRAAQAGLLATRAATNGTSTKLELRAPAAGRVLRISETSERVVAAGAPLLAIGDLEKLEIVVEMLSSEAVKVKAGMPAFLESWGGDRPLRARVRLVEPFAFLKVSALGIEERRTNVILDFVDPPGPLGDGYRVLARVVVWSSPSALKIPISALFRCGERWCVFVADSGRARHRSVDIGQRNDLDAEVLSGIRQNEIVVRHPGNDLADGARITLRGL